MIAQGMVLLAIAAAWLAFYLAVNPPSMRHDDILFVQGALYAVVAYTSTSVKLLELNNTVGITAGVLLGIYVVCYTFMSPERSTNRRIEHQRRTSDLEATH